MKWSTLKRNMKTLFCFIFYCSNILYLKWQFSFYLLGILIAKKHVFLNEVPDNVGGGTVVYVSSSEIILI